jgi:hypothetical protein
MNIRQFLYRLGTIVATIVCVICMSLLMFNYLESKKRSSLKSDKELFNDDLVTCEVVEKAKLSAAEWKLHGFSNLISNAFRKILKIKKFQIEPISVRQGNDLCSDEIAAVANRRAVKVKPALETLLGESITDDEMPNIGLVLSGGGNQAMIASLGFLMSLEKIGVLDACSYLAALSGSTWMLSSWLARNSSLADLNEIMQKHEVINERKLARTNFDAIAKTLVKKIADYQPISFCDIWGGFLADSFFRDLPKEKQEIYLSGLASHMESGNYPFSLFTAAIDKTYPYEWVELSPFEIGAEYLKTWIPTLAFGKYFINGRTVDPAMEPGIGFMMGMFGSAYAAHIKDFLRFALPPIEKSMSKMLGDAKMPTKFVQSAVRAVFKEMNTLLSLSKKHAVIDSLRFSPPQIFNFTRGLKGVPFSKNKFLTLVDAGMACNLPFPPLLRRNVNLYIAADVSGDVIGTTLQKTELYARQKGYKFPKVDLNDLEANKVSLLYDQNDPEVPVVIYIPNREAKSIFKFEFTQKEYDSLRGYMESATEEARETIVQAIRIAISNLKKLKDQPELKSACK